MTVSFSFFICAEKIGYLHRLINVDNKDITRLADDGGAHTCEQRTGTPL